MGDVRCSLLFLIPSLNGGGAERVIVTLLRHLNRNKFKLTLAVVDMRNAVFKGDLPDDVELIDLHCSRVRYALPKICALIWERRPNVVFSTLGHLNLSLALLRPALPDDPRYLARETTIVSRGLQRYRLAWLWKVLYRKYYLNHDRVICQSKGMKDDLIKNFSIPKEKTLVINNPVDVGSIRLLALENLPVRHPMGNKEGSGVLHLVAAGRLNYEKGFDLAIRAIASLNDSAIHLTILGDGATRDSLEELGKELGVADKITFVGFQSNPYAWFSHADAFILSSRYEGFPNVVLEALACGTPVIATPAPGGTREIIEGVAGCFIADEVSAEALSNAIRQWMNSSRSPIAGEAVAPYQASNIVARYEALFDSEVRIKK